MLGMTGAWFALERNSLTNDGELVNLTDMNFLSRFTVVATSSSNVLIKSVKKNITCEFPEAISMQTIRERDKWIISIELKD